MKDIEKLKAKHAKELAQAEKENALLETLPAYLRCPKQVFWQTKKKEVPWVSYEVENAEDAALLIEEFGALRDVSGAGKHGLFSIDCLDYCDPEYHRDPDRGWLVMGGIELRQEAGKGYRTDSFICWPYMYPIRLTVKLMRGLPHQHRTHVLCTYDQYGSPNRVQFVEKRLTNITQKYGTGSRDSMHYVSMFESVAHILRVLCADKGYK